MTHWLDGREFEWTPGVGDEQRGLACCDSWGHKESDMTERLNWTEWSRCFPYFLQFKSEFGNKKFMIWATVSSRSCFCWVYRASACLAAKNIINLISVLTIWLCPCGESSLVLLEEGVCYDQCIFLAKLYQSLPCFIPYSKAKFACYSRCFLTSYFCIPVPYNEKDIIFAC